MMARRQSELQASNDRRRSALVVATIFAVAAVAVGLVAHVGVALATLALLGANARRHNRI